MPTSNKHLLLDLNTRSEDFFLASFFYLFRTSPNAYNGIMDNSAFEKQSQTVLPLVNDLFGVDASYRHGDRLVLSLSYRYNREKSTRLLKDRLKLAGYDFTLKPGEEVLLLEVDPRRKFHIPRINVVLFVITLFTVYFVPVFLKNWLSPDALNLPGVLSQTLNDLAHGAGVEFTLAMISILFVHEMGHYLASRRRGIVTSWPYFIPAPNIIGTFGAVIKSKTPFWNRRDLIEVGAAGPVAGWVVALGWLIYGLSQSTVLPLATLNFKDMIMSMEGESILVRFLTPAMIGLSGENNFYVFTEAAFAGWVGMLITAINLLPVGQLDGGHITYGLLQRKQKYFGWAAMLGLLVLGYQSPMWWFFAAFGFVFGVAHPPTLEDHRPPGRLATVLGIIALIILLISFTPVPFR